MIYSQFAVNHLQLEWLLVVVVNNFSRMEPQHLNIFVFYESCGKNSIQIDLICVIDLNLLAVSRVCTQMVVVVPWASVASGGIADEI